jgi:UDP-N-acetylmuramoyl-tripeptide--D-alanyl-D-alanine ligase
MDFLKEKLFFPVAWYFRIFAQIRLRLWHPQIVVITGSSGKTTLLHLVESQIGNVAKYSHHANSSFGIPFDILGLHREAYTYIEWVRLFLLAPLKVFMPVPRENLYVVEADCDRPGEGTFLAELLKPDITLWISSGKTHSMNFDHVLAQKKFATTEEAIAYEFGQFLRHTSKISFIDGDTPHMVDQIKHASAKVISLKKKHFLNGYHVSEKGVTFEIENKKYIFPYLLPEEVSYSIAMTLELCRYLQLPFDASFSHFHVPPGRSSFFPGKKDITIIDSCSNANVDSMKTMLAMYKHLPGKHKWAVIGDLMEQGNQAQEEHEKVAQMLLTMPFEKLIIYGKNGEKYIHPIVFNKYSNTAIVITEPKEVLSYLQGHLNGGETVLFKGGRLLEGVIAQLLADPKDTEKLCRQDAFWERKRKQAGL